MALGSFTTLFDPGTQGTASELSQLADLLALSNRAKGEYDALVSRTNMARDNGIEPPGDVVRAQQQLYDAWRPLYREVNAARVALLPAIREAARRQSLTPDQMNALADAGVLPRVGGQVIIPAGLGVVPVVVWAVLVIAGAALAGFALERVLNHIRAAKVEAARVQIALDTKDSVDRQWTLDMEARRKIAIANGEPIPPLVIHPNTVNNPAGEPGSTTTSGGGSAVLSGVLAGVSGGTGTAIALAALAWFVLKKKGR